MRKFLKIASCVIGLIVIGIVAVFYFTADMVTVADEFLGAVKSNDIDKAYSYVSDDFKAATSKDAFKDFLGKSGLTGYKSSSWQERSTSGGRGDLTGSVSTESGGAIPLKMRFVKGESGWKIYAIEKPGAGVQEKSSAPAPPSEEELVRMVAATMHLFAVSVNEKNMAKFHEYCSSLMQKQYTVQKLDETFAAFFNLGVDLTLLDKLSPVFDGKVTVVKDNVIEIKGYYPTSPSRVHFEQEYVYEGLSWKLLGLSVNIK
ncbi:MAG: hypothetical protein ABFD97_05815 [Syntrophobacter sp.]